VGGLDLEGLAIVAAAIVDEILNRGKITIFSSALRSPSSSGKNIRDYLNIEYN
jgi:hypothetical protein